MVSSNPNEKSSQLITASINSGSRLDNDAGVFLWKRVLKGLGCGLSICWLLFFFIFGASEDPWHTPARAKAINTVITIVAIFPLLLVLRGRFRYVLAALLFFLIAWILCNYWIHIERFSIPQ
jgi:hypothetical protein